MSFAEHLDKIRYFHKLAQFSSIREASQAIGLSETGLAKSLNVLEDALETKLFLRTKDGLKLTKEGAEVLEISKRILAEAKALETRLRSLKAATAPLRLRLGLYDSIAVYFFSELRAYVNEVYPRLRLELVVDSSGSLLEKLKRDEIDLAIGVNFDRTASRRFRYFGLFDDTYSFYASPEIRGELASLPLILHPAACDGDGQPLEDLLKKPIGSRGAHRVYNFETLKTLTVQGHGVGVLPTQVAKPLLRTGQLLACDLGQHRRHFGTHAIGFLAQESLAEKHSEFLNDLFRLGQRWSLS